jgi:hypothetical protein
MDVHRNGQVDLTANRHFPDAARNCASGSLATLELPKPMLSTTQTPVYLKRSVPQKWSMLRFSLLMLEAASADLISPSASA